MDLGVLQAVSWWAILPLVVLGSLLHFLYDWSGHSRVAAVFGAVNESYWEHIKIAVWPVLLIHVALFAFGGHRYPAYIPAATVSLYAIPVSMVGLVMLYKGITKRNIWWIDITVFGLVIAVAQAIFVLMLGQLQPNAAMELLAAVYLVGLLGAFLKFTLQPPHEPDVCIDPLTNRYGVHGHAKDLDAHLRGTDRGAGN